MAKGNLDYFALELLRRTHAAWRLLAADNAPLIVSFLQACFIAPNLRTLPHEELVARLEDHLFHLREKLGAEAFPRGAAAYLDEWASDRHGWLRKYYPPEGDEPHFDLTPATEKAIEWLAGLVRRPFIGTESRLMTIFELLRQLAAGTQLDPAERIADLEQRRAAIDAEIQRVREGRVELLDGASVKDRFQQIESTARGLLSDFREVEQNFRDLDRVVRERIAAWEGGKGALLDEILGERDAISDSDQGRSFRAFWDFLMSPARQEELSSLLEAAFALPPVEELAPDKRLLRVHYDWMEAGELAQRTVARLSEQLRRYLDDRAFLENRRIMQLLRAVEQQAIAVRDRAPDGPFMALDDAGPEVELAMDRPLYAPPIKPRITAGTLRAGDDDLEVDALYEQTWVDKAALAARVRQALQTREQVSLAEIVAEHPLEQGLAELVAYFSLASEERRAVIDDRRSETLTWIDESGVARRATLPVVIFSR